MNNNLKKLEEWNSSIFSIPKLKLSSAQDLYTDMQNENDSDKRLEKRNRLIEGTLYVVYKFIKSYLCSFNANIFDMDDIINTCNEIWITKIDNGKLLEITFFSEIFNHGFCYELTQKLISNIYPLNEHTVLTTLQFPELLFEYIKLKNEHDEISFNDFLKLLAELDEFNEIGPKCTLFDNLITTYNLFEGIFESLPEDEKYNLKLSKNKIYFFKQLLINIGLEQIRIDINNLYTDDYSNNVITREYYKKILDYIFNTGILNDSQIDVIKRRFGLENFEPESREEIAREKNVTYERIRQIESIALKKLRNSDLIKKIR